LAQEFFFQKGKKNAKKYGGEGKNGLVTTSRKHFFFLASEIIPVGDKERYFLMFHLVA